LTPNARFLVPGHFRPVCSEKQKDHLNRIAETG
jgi:hypothetical protein